MRRYNVKVNGVYVWIEWTTDRWRALREYRAWLNVSKLTCGAVRVSLALAPLIESGTSNSYGPIKGEYNMCCEPIGSDLPVVGECPSCGSEIDKNGDAINICAHSSQDCEKCGSAPCDDSC